MVTFDIVNSTILIELSCSKGVIDGERPLKFHLYNLEFSSLKSVPSEVSNLLSDLNGLKACKRKDSVIKDLIPVKPTLS
jgi:hypothetical protein